jgi:hypothetical protein
MISASHVSSRIDVVTGSMKWETTGLFGLYSTTRADVSPLETKLKIRGIQWTPSWQFLSTTYKNLFGRSIVFEDSSVPPIYTLRPILKEFAAIATDAELRDFVRVMQSGTEAEQRTLIDAIGDKIFSPSTARSIGP